MCRPTRSALPLAVRAQDLVQLGVQGKGQFILLCCLQSSSSRATTVSECIARQQAHA